MGKVAASPLILCLDPDPQVAVCGYSKRGQGNLGTGLALPLSSEALDKSYPCPGYLSNRIGVMDSPEDPQGPGTVPGTLGFPSGTMGRGWHCVYLMARDYISVGHLPANP